MYITKQQILSTVQSLPETIELKELINLFTAIDLKTATIPQTKQTSLSEIAKKYAGCVEGPTDLSTNKNYLEGYGE